MRKKDFFKKIAKEKKKKEEKGRAGERVVAAGRKKIKPAAKTRSILCCVRAESTTLPRPPPPINSPTIAPTTANPEAILKPEKICGRANGIFNIQSVCRPVAEYSLKMSTNDASVDFNPSS